jgi:hypothetical protein
MGRRGPVHLATWDDGLCNRFRRTPTAVFQQASLVAGKESKS